MYSNNKILESKQPISLNDIKYIENKYKFSMPEDIKKHYLKYNGGYPEKSMYTADDGEEFIVEWFIPVKREDGRNDLDSVLGILREDNTIPNWLIPFADEAGGDLYCYSLRENELGAIYYWSHEFDNTVYITKSLETFLNNMVEFSY